MMMKKKKGNTSVALSAPARMYLMFELKYPLSLKFFFFFFGYSLAKCVPVCVCCNTKLLSYYNTTPAQAALISLSVSYFKRQVISVSVSRSE